MIQELEAIMDLQKGTLELVRKSNNGLAEAIKEASMSSYGNIKDTRTIIDRQLELMKDVVAALNRQEDMIGKLLNGAETLQTVVNDLQTRVANLEKA
jgi:hypothetical protein